MELIFCIVIHRELGSFIFSEVVGFFDKEFSSLAICRLCEG